MSWPDSVDPIARELIAQLGSMNHRIALAESCTSGLTAAILGGVPGASNVFCGSMVTYRSTTKEAWLGVPIELIEESSAESQATTDEMAVRLLDTCPEADWAVAVTGHLGPGAPEDKDGKVFFSLLGRIDTKAVVERAELELSEKQRIPRQMEAATRLIEWTHSRILSARG